MKDRIKSLRRVRAAEIEGAPWNWRTHPERQRAAVAASIEELGFYAPLLCYVTAEGKLRLVDGHLHRELVEAVGPGTKVPVIVTTLTEDEAKQATLTHDPLAGMAEADEDVLRELASQVETESAALANVIADLGAEYSLPETDDVVDEAIPEPPKKPVTKPGDLWILGDHRLLCGNSVMASDVNRLVDGEKLDCILTDPPYCSGGFQEAGRAAGSVGTDADHSPIANDRLSTRGFSALLKSAFGNVPTTYIYAFTDWRMWVHLFDISESCGYCVRSMIVWDKGSPGMGRGWRCQHELILWGCRTTAPFDKHAPGKGNVLSCQRTGNVHHTTEKPVTLIADLLNNVPFVRSIYDPFVGSGTTIIAAEQLGRRCYAMEIEPRYVDVCVRRWENLTGKKADRQKPAA